MQNVMDTLSTEKVYTFCFWGVSQFVDAIHWEFKGIIPGWRVDVNSFVGTPPIYIAAYALKDDREQLEVKKPQRQVLAELLGSKENGSAGAVDGQTSGPAPAKCR